MSSRRRRGNQTHRDYSRMARVSELCRHIIAEELERVDDERLDLVTVTHVAVEPDLRHATVYFSALGRDEEAAGEALAKHRIHLQGTIAKQARLKRTPELTFEIDEVIRTGARMEEIIRELHSERGEDGAE
jgi:ribosome-binding factor A